MPTKKRRVGFIPRVVVLELIKKLSFESNLSNSKIINMLVEEALFNRGLFNINTGEIVNRKEDINNQIKSLQIILGEIEFDRIVYFLPSKVHLDFVSLNEEYDLMFQKLKKMNLY